PVTLSIGLPSSSLLRSSLDAVKRHVDAWKRVKVGNVVWTTVQYRSVDAAVEMPQFWTLSRPSEWVDACNDPAVRYEFECLSTLAERTDPAFHSLLVRRR